MCNWRRLVNRSAIYRYAECNSEVVRTKIGKVFGVNGGGSAGLDFLPCQRKEQTEYRSTLGSLELGVGVQGVATAGNWRRRRREASSEWTETPVLCDD